MGRICATVYFGNRVEVWGMHHRGELSKGGRVNDRGKESFIERYWNRICVCVLLGWTHEGLDERRDINFDNKHLH